MMIDAEKTSSKLSATVANVGVAIGGIAIILGGVYKIQDMSDERSRVTAQEVMREVIQEENLLTAAEFKAYVDDQTLHRSTVEAFTLEYMASVDSSLVIILPQLAAIDRNIMRRMGVLETKIDANTLTNTEDKLERVWQFLEAQAKKDSTAQHQRDIMELLRKINTEKLRSKQGDRIQ